MGFLDTLLGRTKPVQPNLDALFELPTAAITLQAAMGFTPTGSGSVCFRATEGRAFSDIEAEVRELLSMGEDAAPVEVTSDSYGFTWLVCRHRSDDMESLVTDLHAVNSSLADGGFGPQLLCTLVGLTDSAAASSASSTSTRRGTFYPFAPQAGEHRDNALELEVRGNVGVGPEDRARPQPVVPGLGRPWPLGPRRSPFRGCTEEPLTCRPVRIESVAVRGL